MKDLKYWQNKIKEKRKKTFVMDFLCELPSWCTLNFYKNQNYMSRYPDSQRSPKLVSSKEFNKNRDSILEY
jgi:hypothetical protein